MPIPVACACGKRFAAKDELAGKTVRCPECRQPLTVPAASRSQPATVTAENPPAAGVPAAGSGVASLLDEVGFHVHEDTSEYCPACDAKLSDHALICVQCGYHLETGKFLRGTAVAAAGTKLEGHEGAAHLLLRKAETLLKLDKVEQRKTETEGMPIWMIVTVLTVVATFVVAMSVLERSLAMKISGYTWIVICQLVSFVYFIRAAIIAFQDKWWKGLLFITFFPYTLYYVITHWDDCGSPFGISIGLNIVSQFGHALVAFGSSFKEQEATQAADANRVFHLDRARPVAVADYDPASGREAGKRGEPFRQAVS